MPDLAALGRSSARLAARLAPRLALALALLACVAGPPVPAAAAPAQAQAPQQGEVADLKAQLGRWQATLDKAANRLSGGTLENEEYEALRAELAAMVEAARAAAGGVAGAREETQRLLDSLGPVPAEGAPAEAQPVAAERKRLSQALAEANGRIQQAELVATRAGILLRTAADKRMTQLTEQLLRRGPIPLAPATWDRIPDQLAYLGDRVERALAVALPEGERDGRLYGPAALALLALLAAWPARRLILRRFGHRPRADRPSYRERVGAMAAETFARSLVPVVPLVAVAAYSAGLIGGAAEARPLASLVVVGCGALASFFLFTGIARATLAPDHPDWALADLEPEAARKLVRRIGVAAAALAAAGAGMALTELTLSPPELKSVVGFGSILLAALALLPLLPGRLWAGARPVAEDDCGCPAPAAAEPGQAEAAEGGDATGGAAAARRVWPRLRLAVLGVVLAALAASGAGYGELASYAVTLLLAVASVAGVLLVLRGILRELLCLLIERGDGRVAEFRDAVVATEGTRRFLGHAGRAAIDAALLAAGLALVLPHTGMTWSEIRGLASAFLGGVTVGGVTIAPGDILSALALFAALVAATRLVQRKLDERVLGRLTGDAGVRHSVRTGIGYLGMTLALVASVGALGLDLSSLAMIAGALSVGIGFGLQNVVSNFVSGLILLAERPIKVGDWVVVDGKEGVVRRISVRATEIQTFQRASVIIPNSEFVSKAVVNWTHKDRTSRIEIRVPAAHGSDARQVLDLLVRIARENPLVLRNPEPVAMFRDFGPSALEFELRAFISDPDRILEARNEIRVRILELFRQHGIQMPHDQRVLHLPGLEATLLRVAAEGRHAPANRDRAEEPGLVVVAGE
jgi:small-conductance mechanosensitive channel